MGGDEEERVGRGRRRLVVIALSVILALVGAGAALDAVRDRGGSSGTAPSIRPSQGPRPAPSRSAGKAQWTPASAKPLELARPARSAFGVPVGYPRYDTGPAAAAVLYLQEVSFLDDRMAREQLTAITAGDSPALIQQGVSEVRKRREGLGLPPSGPTPTSTVITLQVDAVRAIALPARQPAVQVAMTYSLYASYEDGRVDDAPLTGQYKQVVVTWQDDDWKLTDPRRFADVLKHPLPYHADDPDAWADGWRQVTFDG